MHHLAPPPGVGRLRDPVLPEGNRLGNDLGATVMREAVIGDGFRGRDGGHRFAGAETEHAFEVAVVDGVPLGVGGDVQACFGGLERRAAVTADLDGVRGAPVVESRRDAHSESHLAADTHHSPHDAGAVLGIVWSRDRHEVLDLGHTVVAHEAGHQDVGVGQIELPGRHIPIDLLYRPRAATLGVEQRTEDARGVEPGAAEPVDASVDPDHRGGA